MFYVESLIAVSLLLEYRPIKIMGNSVEQYRAAVGIFYMACRHVTSSAQFFFHIFDLFYSSKA